MEDFRLLRERFNRVTVDSFDNNAKIHDKTAGENIFFFSFVERKLDRPFFSYHLTGSLNKEDFITSFESILDLVHYKNQLEKLFDKVYKIKLINNF